MSISSRSLRLVAVLLALFLVVGLSGCSSSKEKGRQAVVNEHVSGPHTVKLIGGKDDADGLERLHVYQVSLGEGAHFVGLGPADTVSKHELAGARNDMDKFIHSVDNTSDLDANAVWQEIVEMLGATDTLYLIKDNRAAHTRLYVVGNPTSKKGYFIFARH